VSALVRGDDMEVGGETETNAANERIRKAPAGQIDLRILPHKRAHLVLRREELHDRVVRG
jgi:hypothetical protein